MAFLNLVNTEFGKAFPGNGLVLYDELFYQGSLVDKVQYFKCVKAGEPAGFLIAQVIRRDEAFIWESARGLIDRAVKQAALTARGVFIFELLSFDVEKELKTFNYNELAQVLVNTTRTLNPGEQTLIKYSSVYGLLQKMVDETWGKIALKTSVDLIAEQPKALFALFSRMLKAVEPLAFPGILLVNDFSGKPLFDPQNSEEQQVLLEDFILKRAKKDPAFVRELFMCDHAGTRKI